MRKRIIHLLTFRFTHSLTHLRASSLNKAKKLKLKQAQSTIEYCTMVALVMVGIVVLGPYVIRSVNAHFKMWEDTTEDAFLDPLSDRDPTGLPTPQCRCPFKPIGCGLGGCKKTEMYWDKDCVPLDCELPEPKCEVENSCCEEEPGPCGVGCPPPGEQQVKITCGNLPPRFECRSTLFCNQCTGFIPDNSTSCPGDDVGVVGQVPWVPVDQGGCTARKCEAECRLGFVLQNGACVKPPPDPACEIFTTDPTWHCDIQSWCNCKFQCNIPACPPGSRELPNAYCPPGLNTCYDNICVGHGCIDDECCFRMCEKLTAPDGGPCTPAPPVCTGWFDGWVGVGVVKCPGDETSVPADMPWELVPPGGCSPRKCEAECPALTELCNIDGTEFCVELLPCSVDGKQIYCSNCNGNACCAACCAKFDTSDPPLCIEYEPCCMQYDEEGLCK